MTEEIAVEVGQLVTRIAIFIIYMFLIIVMIKEQEVKNSFKLIVQPKMTQEVQTVKAQERCAGPKTIETKQVVLDQRKYSEDWMFALYTAYGEAAGEGLFGQKLVLETIRNRVDSEEFPNTMKEVCLQKTQFNAVQNCVPMLGKHQITAEDITPEMQENFEEVMQGSNETEKLLKEEAHRKGLVDEKYWKGGALYFSNWDAIEDTSDYDKIQVYVKVGKHTFWRYWDK